MDEIRRQARVVDQMLSMHSLLRDRYARKAKGLTLGILGCSVVLCTATFLPNEALRFVGVSPLAGRVIVGVFSSLVFFFSIVKLCVAWGEVSSRYGEAAKRVAKLKQQYRIATSGETVGPDACAKLTQEFSQVMEGLPPIPDKQFPSLKAYHLRKVRLSRMIDAHVGCPVWLLQLRLVWQGIFGKKDREGQDQ